MAPIAITLIDNNVDVSKLSAKIVKGHFEVQVEPRKPLADNYMYDFKYDHTLPTTDVLGISMPADVDPMLTAEGIVDRLSEVWANGDGPGFASMFIDQGIWRDKLAFTWDYRTFNTRANIARAANDLLPSTPIKNIKFLTPAPSIQKPYPDIAYLQFVISFDTPAVNAHGVFTAVYTSDGWQLWYANTVIDALLEFPEVPPADGHMTGSISWEKQRDADVADIKPDVVIVGGGQNGLALAARLKAVGVSTLIIERNDRIGEVWTKRYEYLSLHFPHWADHFPYMEYPDRWPTYTPAQKQGLFMEWYASAMELSVWTKSEVIGAEQDSNGNWTVRVSKGQAGERTLHPKHLVMATSLCGVPTIPVVPGMEKFKGIVRHSTAHDSSREFVGKKVLVVGTSSSGFDTAYDCARRGVNVTLLQRSPTYIMSLTHSVPRAIGNYQPVDGVRPDVEEQDRLWFATPTGPSEKMAQRNAKVLEDLDKELLNGLNAKGLKTWRGQRGTGTVTLGSTRNGGFYFDAGACEHILNGNIKVEQGHVEKFTEDKVILSGDRERQFDLVVFATGFSNTIDSVKATLGETIASQVGPIWGVDEEGELKTAYKQSGVHNLWIFVGYLPMTRYHSKRLALRIKALIEGISDGPYTA